MDYGSDAQVDRKLVTGRTSRELRIKPVETESGERKVTIVRWFFFRLSPFYLFNVATIFDLQDCLGEPERRTAKCVRIKCQVSNLANNGNATVTIVSRLWNSTFVEVRFFLSTVSLILWFDFCL